MNQSITQLGPTPCETHKSRRQGRAKAILRFGTSGALSFAVNLGGTAFLHELCGFGEEVAFAVALAVVFVMNFLVMRYYVFPGPQRSVTTQLAMFGASSVGFRGAEYLAFLILHTWLRTQYALAIVAILALSFVCKFVFYRGVVFARRECA